MHNVAAYCNWPIVGAGVSGARNSHSCQIRSHIGQARVMGLQSFELMLTVQPGRYPDPCKSWEQKLTRAENAQRLRHSQRPTADRKFPVRLEMKMASKNRNANST